METRQLGNTGIEISPISLGGMLLSVSSRPPESQAVEVIHRALDVGIIFIDTADAYCKDESDKHHNERLIQKAVQQYDSDFSYITPRDSKSRVIVTMF